MSGARPMCIRRRCLGEVPIEFTYLAENEPSLQFQNLWNAELAKVVDKTSANPELVTKPVRIAIVGGGPAGLLAAFELQNIPQAEIHLYEASHRIGGRVMTVGYKGNFEENKVGKFFWTDRTAYGEAGAMRLPLPPQTYFKKKYGSAGFKPEELEISKFTDEQITKLVHGEAPYDKIPDSDFPHPLVRHYIKLFKTPVKRFNMNVAAVDVDVELGDTGKRLKGFFVRGSCGTLFDKEGVSLDKRVDTFLKEEGTEEIKAWMKEIKSLHEHFDDSIVLKVAEDLKDLTPAKWSQYILDWDLTYTDILKTGRNNNRDLGFKPWPKGVSQFYEDVYRWIMKDRVTQSIVENELGQWWQDSGMFCPKHGMHALYERPEHVEQMLPKDLYHPGIKDKLGDKVTLHYEHTVKRISRKASHKVDIEVSAKKEDGDSEISTKEDFDAVLVTVPPKSVRDLVFQDFPGLEPEEVAKLQLPTWNIAKNLYEFSEPFWCGADGKDNNKCGFKIDGQQGFVTASRSVKQTCDTDEPDCKPKGHLSQLHYAIPKEGGNIMLNFEFEADAEPGNGSTDDTIFDFIKEFHPEVDVKKKAIMNQDRTDGVSASVIGKFRAPWEQIAFTPHSKDHVDILEKYCNYSAVKGIYFAGDAWSFKPQWQEGSFYTALHSVYKIIHDLAGTNAADPFQYS